ncbi:NAD(P)/FAD-dependent oxidoreductase [Chlorogloea sp. CCALA 695]|uniref:NAD(P)/FAD-dependent oxidoreductase n=1 Tax=Chlorogloea sp. CCALA 695 TaxID=2107693 RepID=UPI000D070542|nr:flavin-dependent dehydrogenase [Chlorogloea sp. CCALA 695]PSB32878.1 flavin-dependent dehydrogenase [Chlorogloea sp. CCALA 695]
MKEILYIEIPTPETACVRQWLHEDWLPLNCEKLTTPVGVRLQNAKTTSLNASIPELSIFTWSVQRTTYLKVFRLGEVFPNEQKLLTQLTNQLNVKFPQLYPEPPTIDLANSNIFEALAPYYPLTAKYFQKMPNGEKDLQRVYWWEQRWREGVCKDEQPTKQVVFSHQEQTEQKPEYDLIYIGGALGIIHAAVMAQLGYRVLLLERLPFGKMNREWNISRSELQSLIDLGLLTSTEAESIIAREYIDGFNKFFDGNNPNYLKSAVLHTPTVLNICLESEKLLQLCGEKLKASGGEIWDLTEFVQADVNKSQVTVTVENLKNFTKRKVSGRLLVDAMGTASPIAWQLNGKRAFDSVCPTVGAVVASGFEPGVWDSNYGDVLNSHGDTSRGRQLIWELFPGSGEDLTVYLFHYHQVNKINPGSLLEMYEDFFTILPEYRRCDLDKLVWKKPTFGYIPGHFSSNSRDRTVAFDRLIAIGDAASLQSPLVFTGFGSLVRNLGRLTELLDTALQHDLLSAKHLNQIRAYQSNIAVTWLFSKGMMVPTGKHLPPQRINSMLNTFFGLLADEPLEVADNFIKDRFSWFTFNRLALKAAFKNPALLPWIWDLAGAKDIWRWLGNYFNFGIHALISAIFASWFPQLVRRFQPSLEPRFPALWFKLLNISYSLTAGLGQPYTNLRGAVTPIDKRETELSSQHFNY